MSDLICIGAGDRISREKNDFYATDPIAIIELMKIIPLQNVWECACGAGHLAKPMNEKGILNKASDLIYRGYGEGNVNFLEQNVFYDGDIVTNPPFKDAVNFARKALEILANGRFVCLFLKLSFLESQERGKFFEEYPPKFLFVSRKRIMTAKGGNFDKYKSSALAYGWFVWEKGFKGKTVIEWFN